MVDLCLMLALTSCPLPVVAPVEAEPPKPVAVEDPAYPKHVYYGQIPEEWRDSKDYPYAELINEAANAANVDPMWMYNVAGIESDYNPRNRTGSYKGLFQLSDSEFQRHGGGNIYDAKDNARAAARMFAEQRDQFLDLFGRYPNDGEAYMIHQQGIEGCAAHIRHPNDPAWENMYSTGEGRQRGRAWSKLAIWGNLPAIARQHFGDVGSVTSKAFVDTWSQRLQTGAWPHQW